MSDFVHAFLDSYVFLPLVALHRLALRFRLKMFIRRIHRVVSGLCGFCFVQSSHHFDMFVRN